MESLRKLRERTSWESLSDDPSSSLSSVYRRTTQSTSSSEERFRHSSMTENTVNLPSNLTISDRMEFLNNLSANIVKTLTTKPKLSSNSHCLKPRLSAEVIFSSDERLTAVDSADLYELAQNTKEGRDDCYKMSRTIPKSITNSHIGNHCNVKPETNNSFAKNSTVSLATNINTRREQTKALNIHGRCYSISSDYDCDDEAESNPDEIFEPTRHFSQASSYTTISSLPLDDIDSIDSLSIRETDINFELEQSRLSTVLSRVDPYNFLDYFKKRLNDKHDKNFVSTLSKLLPKKDFSGETAHCVRCHNDYDSSIFGDTTCMLQHQEKDVMLVSEDDKCAVFQCDQCFTCFKVEGIFRYTPKTISIAQCGPCFIGKHTDNVENMTYDTDGIVQTCSDKGCFVYFV